MSVPDWGGTPKPFGLLHRRRARCVFWTSHRLREIHSRPSSDGLVTEDQLTCGALNSSYLYALSRAAALRRHTQAGDDVGAHHSPRPLVKTRRYESPDVPAPQAAPKVLQVEVGERGAGQRLDNFLG